MKYNNSALQILHVRKDDSDFYYCSASNLLGRVEKKTLLVVVSPPRFTVKPPAKVVALVGGILILNCSATGDPQPVVTWKKQGGQLSVRRSQQINGDLVIRSVTVNDKGIYSCVATNAGVFKAEADTFIEVKGKSVGKTREDILFRTMQRLIERSLCIKSHKRHQVSRCCFSSNVQ